MNLGKVMDTGCSSDLLVFPRHEERSSFVERKTTSIRKQFLLFSLRDGMTLPL